jgi:class 3 adenylate cyclase/tetratricopeptide (TPR) repeat protein
MTCPRCHQPVPADAEFCPECGARLETGCVQCGTANARTSKFCKKCGQPLGRPATRPPEAYTPAHLTEKIVSSRGALEGERKQVTVLFADLKGSMELLADRDPEEARKVLDPVLELMMEAVHRYEGTVNQVMGDGIMALFGAPLAHEDHAVRACYAALRMQDAIRRYSADVRRAHGVEVQIRVGLNSGEVVVRSIGSDLHMDYTAVGQTTHLAARMEQLATPGTVRITAETLRLAEGYVQVTPLGPVPVKGLTEPIDVYALTAVGPVRTRLQATSPRGLTRFVGRDAEIAQLRAAAEQAQRSRGQVVAVVGEPGVGKSRLFYEFIHSHRTHGWLILEAASVSYGKSTAYLPLVDLLKAYFKIEDRDDIRAVRAKVTGMMLTLDEGLKGHVTPVLWLLDALGEDLEFLGLEPSQRRQRTLEAVKRVILRESGMQPLLLVFEDLHWIDAETQGFLDALVESLPASPVLLAVNYRPEYQHAWSGKTYYRQLRIDPLAPESAEELLTTLLGADSSVEPLRRILIDRTEGNPLFLEESVRALVETRVLSGDRGGYRLVRALDAIHVPDTVQAILGSRIDRLPPEDKRLLQAAAVVGKDVPFVVLQAIAGLAEEELHRGLGRLQAAEFLYEARLFPDLEYTFKHALTHEVAYASLLADRRRALHAAIVAAIERLSADRLGEHLELLGHHAERGELWERAARYLHQAGLRAAARSAYREAVDFFERALAALAHVPESAESLSQALDIRLDIGPVLTALKGAGTKEVEDCYQRAAELSQRLGQPRPPFPVLWGLWFVENLRGNYRSARTRGEELLEVARQSSDRAQLLQAHHSLWPILVNNGEFAAAEVHLREGLALYDPQAHRNHAFLYGNHDPGVCALMYSSRRSWLAGQPDAAQIQVQEAVRLARQLSLAYTLSFALHLMATVHYWRGEAATALGCAEEIVELLGPRAATNFLLLGAKMLRCLLAEGASRDAAIAELHREFTALKAGAGAVGREVFLGSLLAELYWQAGQPQAALAVVADALTLSQAGVERSYEAELRRLHGELLGVTGAPPADVERTLRGAVQVAREMGARSLELRSATSLARLLAASGRRAEAREALAPVYATFTEGFDTADLRTAKALLAELG